jgi:VanZ family protein
MILKKLSWVPSFILMVIIFLYSAKPVDSSNASSMTIANKVITMYESITDKQIPVEIREARLEFVNHIVRKGAHVAEYALLAFTIAFHLWIRMKRDLQLFLLSVLFAAIYAATDEFHQIFVPGRGPQVKDVFIDTAGATLGAFLFCLLITLITKRTNKKEMRRQITP